MDFVYILLYQNNVNDLSKLVERGDKMRKLREKIILNVLLFSLLSTAMVYGQDYASDSLSLTVFIDGNVDIEYVIEPDTTLAQVNVTLFGDSYQELLVVDPEGVILDWGLMGESIEIDSLGSTSVSISYTTTSLTDKTGSQWSVSIDSTTNVLYSLPEGAVLVGLNPAPIGISSLDNHAIITMPTGFSSISYLLGTTGTRENALVLLNTAKKDVNEALEEGIVVSEAEVLLDQAIQAYQNEEYTRSEQYSRQASEMVKETEGLASDTLSQINAAKSIIELKRGQIEAEVITQAQEMITQAETQYEQGEYPAAKDAAEEAYSLVLDAPEVQGGNWLLYGAVALLVVLAGAGYWYISRRETPTVPQKPDTEQPEVDLDEVFSKNPQLRTDDKAILRFLEESRGAFITEVRDRFDIPKSSAWRMARRLEEAGLIAVTKVGRETYLQLRKQEE